MLKLRQLPAKLPTLVIHGGAGGRIAELSAEQACAFTDGLTRAYQAGWNVLACEGSALDAVAAAVVELENNPLFNAGVGAALNNIGAVEHDACIMAGDGAAGAVASSKRLANPILFAKKILEESPHVMIVDPNDQLSLSYGLELVDNATFITRPRQAQLARVQADTEVPLRHGTVGAVALDADGFLACATSTGGFANKMLGRVGDTPIVGAGSFARDGVVAISCTGDGEAYIEGCVAHDVYARMAYGQQTCANAIESTFAQELDSRQATGGLIAVTGEGEVILAHNSAMMLAAFCDENEQICTWI